MPEKRIKSYAGFTIGPIYDVMRHSKKTRELWFGSYFFSWYMERLTTGLKKNNQQDIEFFTPYISPNGKIKTSLGGKFHDRFVLASKSLEPEKLYEIIKSACEDNLKFFEEI